MKNAKQIDTDLKSNKWSNDTLSPLSTKEYFKLSENLIDEEEIAKSALMAISFSKTFNQQKNMIIATDQRLAIAKKIGGIRYKNHYINYEDVLELKIAQDYYMPAKMYFTFKYRTHTQNKFQALFFGKKVMLFEVMDPTSSFHFKRYLDQQMKRFKQKNQNSEPQ